MFAEWTDPHDIDQFYGDLGGLTSTPPVAAPQVPAPALTPAPTVAAATPDTFYSRAPSRGYGREHHAPQRLKERYIDPWYSSGTSVSCNDVSSKRAVQSFQCDWYMLVMLFVVFSLIVYLRNQTRQTEVMFRLLMALRLQKEKN